MKKILLLYKYIFLLNIFRTKIIINSINIQNDEESNNNTKIKRKLSNTNILDYLIKIESIDDKVSYITSTKDENGIIYITTNTENKSSLKRLIYIINPDFSQEYKIMNISSSAFNKYPIMTYLKISSDKYLLSLTQEGFFFSIINYEEEKIIENSIFDFISTNSIILKNTFTSLKYYENKNIIISAFIEKKKSNFIIQKLNFTNENITKKSSMNAEEKNLGTGMTNTTVTCFEFDNYIECLYTNSNLLYTVSVFDIPTFENIYNEILDTNEVQSQQLFSKCIHVKNKLGAFIYFLADNLFPKIQFKNFEINESQYLLSDYINEIHIININSHGSIPFSSNYIYNDIIKLDEKSIIYISTAYQEIELFILFIQFLNDDKNILLNYYRIKLNDNFKISIYQDINLFSINEYIGIGMTHYNFDLSSNETFSSLLIFGYLTFTNEENFTTPKNINIFDEESNYSIQLSEIIEKVEIKNNLFGYELAGIKIISYLYEEMLGFDLYSNTNKRKKEINELIYINDSISFKLISNIGVKLNNYSIEYEIIMKEPEFEDFISYAKLVEYLPEKEENNASSYQSYFQPKYLSGRHSYINFSVNECFNRCQSCTYLGDNMNHHCDICSEDYPFIVSITNGYNCFDEIISTEIVTNEKNNITVNTSEGISTTKVDSTEERYTEKTNSEESTSKESNTQETSINKNTDINSNEDTNEIKKTEEIINIENNNCKKKFFIDKNLVINCIDSDICVNEYPYIDKINQNMCTNCAVKYNNECYDNCPENTCIKQDSYLDICIDIDSNTKVINSICLENFQNLTSNIKEMSDKNVIINNNPNLTIYGYYIGKNESYFEENNLTYIYFKDIQDNLIKDFNLDNNTKIYALIVDSTSKYSNSTINDYGFALVLENGTELNLSKISEDLKVKISIPIQNLELANYDSAIALSEQGYDIYDKNSSFYHDICTPGYLNDNDLTLNDRRKEIFINDISYGKSNCEYILTDLNNKRFIYNCFISETNEDNTNNNIVDSFDEKTNENFLSYILDVINYKVFICSKLILNLDNYRHNKAVMICTTSSFIAFLLFIIFFCSRLPKLRVELYKIIPTKPQIKKLIKQQKLKYLTRKTVSISNPIKRVKKDERNQQLIKNESLKFCYKDSILLNTRISISDKIISLNIKRQKRLLVGNNKKKLKLTNKNLIKQIIEKNIDDLDDLPFKMALRMDNRNSLYLFGIKLTEKIKLIDIFVNKKLKEISFSEYFLYLLIDLTTNSMLYSDNIVSHKSHHNGKIDAFVILSLSAFANILASIIGYYLDRLVGFEEKISRIKEIKNEINYLKFSKIMLREIKIRVIIFFFCEIILIFFCAYYLFIFFTIYHKSQLSLLRSVTVSRLESLLINVVITIFIVAFRKSGIYFRNKYIYNISKYLDKNF